MLRSLVSIAVDKLSNIFQDELALQMGVPEEVQGLHSTFKGLQAVLEDAEGRRVNEESVILWREKLKDLSYDMDDILDEWQTEEARRSQADEEDGSRFSLHLPDLPLRHEIGSRIMKAKQRLDDIEEEANLLGLSVDREARQIMDSEIRSNEIRDRETSSLVNESAIVGRDDDAKEVRGLLMGESSEVVHKVPTVVSVLGTGGLGKTTLAQLLFNDENVKHHFEMRAWVYVSQDFDVNGITKSIIESAGESSCDLRDLDPLQRCLRDMVRGKRFLLVLDDAWSEESGQWEILKVPLQAGAPGSRVIITTRSETVAAAVGSTHVHKLPLLSENDNWLLFSQRAFRGPNAKKRSKLEKTGREIVQKCRGLPLAAKTIGSVMTGKRKKREWELVLENEIWSSPDVSQGGILPSLLLSYYNLPSPLKQCFAYCSIFPKDYYINKDDLIKLWMAQGFIRSEGSGAVEEIGGQYIDELLGRSLLQDVDLDRKGDIWTFKMHDLVHDLAQFVARGECLLVEKGKTRVGQSSSSVRHATVLSDDVAVDAAILGASCKAEKLRTMIFLRDRFSRRHDIAAVLASNLFDQLRSLRALCLSETNANKLPHTIGKLRHLRCLDLSFTKIVELPETVADLYNLQTLNLNRCSHLCKLPERLRKLINLRHLELGGTIKLKCMPRGIGRLTALRTLTKFIVGDGQKECALAELKNLNHLRKLRIKGLEKVVHMEEAREAELDKKQYLNKLYLKYNGEEEVNGMLESLLRPHSNLKALSITGYLGSTLPRWLEDPSFSNLVSIHLYGCDTCKQLPCLGKLPSLKFLDLSEMKEVRHVGVEFFGVDDENNSNSNSGGVLFPKLEELRFVRMMNWEEWEWELRGGVVIMSSLLTIAIFDCPKLKALPENLSLSLENLYLMNDSLFLFDGKLSVFPNLKRLNIGEFDGIKSIPGGWLEGLHALNELLIWSCPELESLPEEIQHLTMLRKLETRRCPRLKERYKEGGEDWHRIAHIPNVFFR